MASESRKVVLAALAGNVLVAATKTVAAVVTGSSGMLSEAVHSGVDTVNEVLLLYGQHRSRRKPDAAHPFGYGRELYFWSLIVALLIFALGAGVSAYEGVHHLNNPAPIEKPLVSYIVLAVSFLFEAGSWLVALRTFRASKGEMSYWRAIRDSKDPPQFMVLLEDTAALVGIAIAAAGTWLSVELRDPRYDGYASLLIAIVLAIVAAVLARESKGLLIGERADPQMQAEVTALARAMPDIIGVNGVITSQMAPDQVVVAMSIEFDDRLSVVDIERIVAGLEKQAREKYPAINALFVKPQSPQTFETARKERLTAVS